MAGRGNVNFMVSNFPSSNRIRHRTDGSERETLIKMGILAEYSMAGIMQSSGVAMEEALHESIDVYPAATDRRDPAQGGPTAQSIARARAAQQRERAAFTLKTGLRVDPDGQMVRRRVVLDAHLTKH